jgi:hypothetical protein
LFSYAAIGPECQQWFGEKYSKIRLLIFRMLKEDPVGAYVELKREYRRESIELEKSIDQRYITCEKKYLFLLNYFLKEPT